MADGKAVPRNPVTEARRQVEAEVPPSRRGPGWDRHWRELEAYAAAQGEWPLAGAGQSADGGQPGERLSPEGAAAERPKLRRRRGRGKRAV